MARFIYGLRNDANGNLWTTMQTNPYYINPYKINYVQPVTLQNNNQVITMPIYHNYDNNLNLKPLFDEIEKFANQLWSTFSPEDKEILKNILRGSLSFSSGTAITLFLKHNSYCQGFLKTITAICLATYVSWKCLKKWF